MRSLLFLLLLIPSIASATCTMSVGKVPVTTTASPTPQICDGDITDINSNIGIGSATPGATLDVQGTLNRFDSLTTGSVLCLTATHTLGHCTAAAACTGTCTCTCTQG